MPTKKNLKKVNLLESFKQGGTVGRHQDVKTFGEPQPMNTDAQNFPKREISDDVDINSDLLYFNPNQAFFENNPEEGLDRQKDWLTTYIQSPMYLERLSKEFPNYSQSELEAERDARLNNVITTKVTYPDEPLGGSFGYIAGRYWLKGTPENVMIRTREGMVPQEGSGSSRGRIELEPEYRPEGMPRIAGAYAWPSPGFELVPLHELGHSADDLGVRIPETTRNLIYDNVTPPTDGIFTGVYESYPEDNQEFTYFGSPSEFVNRLLPFRYELQRLNIVDPNTQQITESDIKKYLESSPYIKDAFVEQLFDNVKGEGNTEQERLDDQIKRITFMLNNIAMNESQEMFYGKQGGTVGRHQDISTIKKSDIVLPGRRNIHTGEYVKPGEGIDPTTYISDALNEFDQLRTTAGQNKVVNILTNDPTLTLQEAVDQAGYGRSSWLMGLTPYAPFGKQYLPEEAIEFSRMRDYTPMELLNDEWFMSNYGDQIRAGFSGQFKGMGETLKGVGESIKDVFTTKPPVDTVGTKKEGGVHRAQDAKEYVDPMKYKPVVGNRIGARQNPDGSESTHLMAYSKVDDLGGYVAFPTLFQNEQGEFYEPENPIAEAVKKNEIYRFGNDLESAKEFAAGSWKSNMQSGGLFQNPVLSMLDRAKELGDEMVEMELNDMLSNGTDDTFGFNFIPTDENGCEIEIVFQAQEGGYSRNQNGIISEKLEEAKDKAKSYKETMDYANNPNYVNQDQSIIGKVLDATRFILDSENNAQEYLKLEEYSNQHAQALNDYYNNLDRADKIAYNIDRVAYGNPQLRELLYNTAYMENSFGTNDKAYGRGYTHSFMSLDDPAINHIFDKREGATKYTEGQENTFKMFESLGLPTDKESFIELLDKDDPLASVAAARAYYATVPDELPPSNDPSAMYQYFVDHYNKGGQNKYQDNEEGKARFMEGYSILDDKYNFSAPKSEYMNHNPVPFDFESYLKENPVILDFENGGTVPPEILVSPAGVFDPNYIAGEPVIVPTTRGVIAMDGVEIDLVGISDLGEIRYLPANSGNHQFRGTNIVEYPADVFYGKDGGLADWFKEEWVRIDTEGNITGPCGTMKKGKATTRCLPRKKAQSLTKAERKATARKKVRGSKKGKQFVANTRKAKVTKKDTKRG